MKVPIMFNNKPVGTVEIKDEVFAQVCANIPEYPLIVTTSIQREDGTKIPVEFGISSLRD